MKRPNLVPAYLLISALIPLTTTLSIGTSAFAQTEEIANFRQVAPGIFAGANPIDGIYHEDAFKALVRQSIKTDIDLQGTDITEATNLIYKFYNQANEPGERPEMIARERNLARSAGMNFVNLSLNSNNSVSSKEGKEINRALDLLSDATPAEPVYLHCEHGADRTGLVIALYRVLREGRDIDDAYAEWMEHGHNAAARIVTGQLDVYFCAKVLPIASSEACGPRI